MTTIITFKANNIQCELLCKKETILAYRSGILDINNVVASDTLYTNAKKGNTLSMNDFEKIFGKIDNQTAIKLILQKGKYTLTTNEYRKQKQEAIKAFILHLQQNYTNPSGTNYTFEQIENVLKKIKANIDPSISPTNMYKKLKRKIENHIRLKEVTNINTTYMVPYNILGKVQNILQKYQTGIEYDNDVVKISVSLPACKTENISVAMQQLGL